MSQAQFTIPLITVIPGQLITAALWNNEFTNLQTNLNPSGIGGYSDTDPQMQIQTAPYPGSVTSHATSNAGELERIRYQMSQITGNTYWYQAPAASISTLNNVVVPIGGVIDYPEPTGFSASWLLADGTAISRTLYSTLFSIVGTSFGIGDGTTTFNIPNYVNRMSIGAGSIYARGDTGGEATHTLITAEIPSVTVTDPGHIHGTTETAHSHSEQYATGGTGSTVIGGTNGSPSGTNGSGISTGLTSIGLTINSHTTGITVAGGGGAHNNLPPYLGMYKIIRVI